MQMKMRNYLNRGLALVGILMLSMMAFAQQARTVKGKVTDEKGESIPGVNVSVQGTTIGTITDMDGNYTLEIANPDKAVLVFSFIGYQAANVTVGAQTTINTALKEEAIGLNEVVAIGYGVVKKKDLTGSVSSIKSEEISKTTSSNAMQAMQAKVPGMDITQASGQAGSKVNINLRGKRSILAENDPLIMVDGVEYGSTLDINPSDIESMDVLKDASSTAIYGAKGANGVILITTKRGKAGKTRVNINSFISSNTATNVPKMIYGDKEVQRIIDKANYRADDAAQTWGVSNLTPTDVLTLSLADGTTEMSIYNDKSYTNWADVLLQDGLTQNYEASVSGGNDNTTYNISLGTMLEEGLLKNDEMDRYNAKLSIDHKINDVFKVGTSMLYTYKSLDARDGGVFNRSMSMTSITHPYLTSGDINKTPNPRYAAHSNPLLDEVNGAYADNTESTRFFGNTYLEISPIKDLRFKSLFSLDRNNSRQGKYMDYESVGRLQSPATSGISSEYKMQTNLYWENTLNYMTDLGGSDHSITAMLGQTMFQKVYEQTYTTGDAGQEHYYQSSYYDLSKILAETTTSAYVKETGMSYFGRLNYSYKERYLLTASVRADGQSTLSSGNKWGSFPSVSAGWRINNESFMESTNVWLSNLKLRASWGVSGNAAIKPYQTLTTLSGTPAYYYTNAKSIAGYYPSNMGNEDLKWETTEALNFGLDFGFLNNRITGTVDYYMSETSDLLYYQTAPSSSVYPTVIGNIGSTKGNGIEVALNTLVVKNRDFSYDINWSYSTSDDEVTGLAQGLTKNISGKTGQIVGERVNIFFDYEDAGMWNVGEYAIYKADWESRHQGETIGYMAGYGTPGSIKIIDRNDDGKLDDDDKRVYERDAKHIFGMNNTFTYKDISLSVLIYARTGGIISYDYNGAISFEDVNWADLDYWTVNNTGARFPSPGLASANQGTHANYGSALLYENADFIKIKDITLAYSLPKNFIGKAGIEKVRFYGSLKNYFTFSNIDNYDPERGGSISFPLAKQVVIGMNLEF
jgi:TonB-linked SusC/RagA family outer membrane protein